MKPTWGAINREGLKMLALSLDTLGLFARSAEDLDLLADVFALEDRAPGAPFALRGARIAACRSPAWDKTEPATRDAFERGVAPAARSRRRGRAAGAAAGLRRAARASGDRDGRRGRSELPQRDPRPAGAAARGPHGHGQRTARAITKAALVAAYDAAAQCRIAFDEIAAGFDAVLTPSARGEAPVGTTTGDAAVNAMWTLLHVPVVQVPGFKGPAGMPVGLSLVSPRYTDRRLLAVGEGDRAVV